MCVIIHSPDKQHRPSLETLRLCARKNPHGSGLAWHDGEQVSYTKSLRLRPERIAEMLCDTPGEVLIHFRFATVGGIHSRLCHPFPVTASATPHHYGRTKKVLFHNGTWSDWAAFGQENMIELHGPVSDTRMAAIGTYLGDDTWLKTIPGRFALMEADGVTLIGDWKTHRGSAFSNFNWCPEPALVPFIVRTKPKPHRDPGDAMVCFGD